MIAVARSLAPHAPHTPSTAANGCSSPRQLPEPRVNGSRLPATLHYNYETAARARTQAAANNPQYGAAKGRALYEEYHPFGTTAYRAHNNSIDVSAKRYRYTGMERDEETGLAYHGARYYASWLGRWTASDPIGLGGGINRFEYSRGNPIRLSDPGGTSPLDYLPTRQEIAEFAHETAEVVEAAAEAAGSATFEALEGASPTGAAVAATAVETTGKLLGGAATIGVEIAGGAAEAPEHLEAGAKAISTGVETGNLERVVAGVGELATAAKPVFEALLLAAGGVKGKPAASLRAKPTASSRAKPGETAPARSRSQRGEFEAKPRESPELPADGPRVVVDSDLAAGGGASRLTGPLRNRSGDLEDAARAARTQPQLGPMATHHALERMATRGVTAARVEEAALRGRIVSSDSPRGTVVREMPAASSASGRATRVVTTARGDSIVTVIDRGRR